MSTMVLFFGATVLSSWAPPADNSPMPSSSMNWRSGSQGLPGAPMILAEKSKKNHMAMGQNAGTRMAPQKCWLIDGYSLKYGNNRFWPMPISIHIPWGQRSETSKNDLLVLEDLPKRIGSVPKSVQSPSWTKTVRFAQKTCHGRPLPRSADVYATSWVIDLKCPVF